MIPKEYPIMSHQELLGQLRKDMKAAGLDALIILSSDPHMNEYLPDYWKIMSWLTGFTGSAGTVVITTDFAGVWTDSRYFIQAEKQLGGSGFDLVKLSIPHTPEFLDWLAENLPEGSRIGYDGTTVSVNLAWQIEQLARENKLEVTQETDLITPLWKKRPPLPDSGIFLHKKTYTGIAASDKIQKIRHSMSLQHADVLLLSTLDEIAWLFNLRATDIKFNPVFLGYAMILTNEARLYVNLKKLNPEVRDYLEHEEVTLYDYEKWWDHLSQLPEGSRVWLSTGTTSIQSYKKIEKHCTFIKKDSPVALEKAIKNPVELSFIRETMIHDGVALERFFFWLETHWDKERITEISAAAKLEYFRKKHILYQGASFETISSFGPHGAIVHYTPSPETDLQITSDSLFLLDSGGQYPTGTTDVTRTIVIGKPTRQQQEDFTRVLKGMISLSNISFPEGTKGFQLDILARRPLWKAGINYGHGTGHGVGYFLNVHEGPQAINTGASGAPVPPIIPGMVISNEPGIYRENEYGIRIENLILCIPEKETSFGKFLTFETLTLCHIDKSLIMADMLTREEKNWLNHYHKRVFELISPVLKPKEKTWLSEKTAPLE